MWSSVLLILFAGIVVLRARSVPNDSLEEASVASAAVAPPNAQKFWKNGYAGYSTIPLTESSGQPWPEQTRDCNCAPKMRFPRRSKLRAVIRRNDMVLGDPEDALEHFLEEYLLRLYLNKGLFSPPVSAAAVSTRKISKGKTRTQKQVQSLPAFQHEKAVYSDEENYRISHNSRFYSQEPVPGQLLYPPVSPKFHPVVRPYGTTHVNIQSKPRYVSSMLIPHFLNQSMNEPKEIIRNILRASTTTTATTPVMTNENDHVTELPKRVRYAKNSGYINSSNWSREKHVTSGGANNTKVQ